MKDSKPLFTRADYMREARRLGAAAVSMDKRTAEARRYLKWAAMLVYADANMPKGIPDAADLKGTGR